MGQLPYIHDLKTQGYSSVENLSTDAYAEMTVDTSGADELEHLQCLQQVEESLQSTEAAEEAEESLLSTEAAEGGRKCSRHRYNMYRSTRTAITANVTANLLT